MDLKDYLFVRLQDGHLYQGREGHPGGYMACPFSKKRSCGLSCPLFDLVADDKDLPIRADVYCGSEKRMIPLQGN